jgi:hypothetical protein
MLSIRAWKEFSAAMSFYGRTDLRDKYNNYAREKILALKKDTAWYQGDLAFMQPRMPLQPVY